MEGKKGLKKRAGHARLVDGSLKKKGNLHMRLVLGDCKTSRSLRPPARILKVYTETLTGFSHISCPDGLNNISLSQGCVLEASSYCGNGGKKIHSKDRGGSEKPPVAWVQLVGQLALMSSQLSPPTIRGVVS